MWDAYNDPIPDNNDGSGHGTHCAGTVGGATTGVAPGADLYGVKVLSDSGAGSFSDIIGAIYWVIANGFQPGVVSMSLGGGRYDVINNAIDDLAEAVSRRPRGVFKFK